MSTLAAELHEAADALAEIRPNVAARLRERAEKLEGGATLDDLAAAGDACAALVVKYERHLAAGPSPEGAAPEQRR